MRTTGSGSGGSVVIILILLVCCIGLVTPAASQTDARAFYEKAVELYNAGEYAEATSHAERATKLAEEELGPDSYAYAITLNLLAILYQTQGRTGEAEPLYKRALAIREKALGPENPAVADSLDDLARLYPAFAG